MASLLRVFVSETCDIVFLTVAVVSQGSAHNRCRHPRCLGCLGCLGLPVFPDFSAGPALPPYRHPVVIWRASMGQRCDMRLAPASSTNQ